jgi:hypothetical protein
LDARREPRLQALAASENAILRARGQRGLAVIARRRTHRSWLIDARIPGRTTPVLNAGDAEGVERWLFERGFRDGRPLPATGRPPTPRCWDRMTWTAILAIGGRIDDRGAALRLKSCLRDEIAFWRRLAGRDRNVG